MLEQLSEPELFSRILELQKSFVMRERLGEYSLDPKLVSAYSCFYLPTNIFKIDFLVNQISSDFLKDWESASILDWGCGPGTYGWGLLNHIGSCKKLILSDSSPIMLEQARKIYRWAKSNWNLSHDPEFSNNDFKGKVDLMIFGNVINEMGHEKIMPLIEKYNPRDVLIIEPGTSESFENILPLREGLLKNGFQIHFPCSTSSACPIQNDKNDWCHQVVKTSLPQWLERISQKCSINRRTMPLIGHLYSKKEVTRKGSGLFFRMLGENPGTFTLIICLENREGGQSLIKADILKRHLSKKQIKAFKKLSIGTKLDFVIEKEFAPNHCRIKLDGSLFL